MTDFAELGIKYVSVGADKAVADAHAVGTATTGAAKAAEDAAKRLGISTEEFHKRTEATKAKVAANIPVLGQAAAAMDDGSGDSGSGKSLGGATRRSSNALDKLTNTLTHRFIIGYAISQVGSLISALAGLSAEMAKIQSMGSLLETTGSAVQGIIGAAGNKGIASDTMAGALIAFNQQIPLAKVGMGSLGEMFRDNKVTVTGTTDAFYKLADLVKNAANDTSRLTILQQAGLPATIEMVRHMAQGSIELRKQADEVSKMTDTQLASARKIEDRWNELWNSFKTGGKSAIVEVADGWVAAWNRPFMDPSSILGGWWNKAKLKIGNPDSRAAVKQIEDASSLGTPLPGSSPLGQGGIGGDSRYNLRANPTKDGDARKIAEEMLARQQRYNSALGETRTREQELNAVELTLQKARLDRVGLKPQDEANIRAAAEARIDGARLQVQASNTVVSAEQFRIQKQKELGVELANGTLTQEKYDEAIQNYARHALDAANASEVYASKMPGLTQAIQQYGDTAKQVDQLAVAGLGQMGNSLLDFQTGVKSGKDAVKDFETQFVRSLLNMMNQMIIMEPIARTMRSLLSSAGSGGGISGLLGGLFGGDTRPGAGEGAVPIGPLLPSANGNVFSGQGISHYSNSIVTRPTFFAKGGNVMGEAGPEAIMPLSRGPGGRLGVSGGGSNVVVNVINNANGTKVETKEREEKGTNIRDIIISTVNEHTANGGMDSSMRGRYGIGVRGKSR